MNTKNTETGMTTLAHYKASSQRLMQCLAGLEAPTEQGCMEAAMELTERTSAFMPEGRPALLETRNYPQIATLERECGRRHMIKVLCHIIRQFCNSLNVVRNMNDSQIMEAACMMLDECGNFRLEDYILMFAMALRGQLIKIYDRIDIAIISQLMDAYWQIRHEAGRRKQQEITWQPPENPVAPERLTAFFHQFTEDLKQNTQETMNEADYQRIRREYMLKQMQEKAKSNESNE